MLKIYGNYLSQPARSVLWLLKSEAISHEFMKVQPLAGTMKTPEM